MLQIATGRFHQAARISRQVGHGILFSNFGIFRDVQTPIGVLRRSHGPRGLQACVHEYFQHHTPPDQGVWVWGGDQELNDDLAAVMTAFLSGFFDADQHVVLDATQNDPRGHPRDDRLPANFLPSKLNPPIRNPAGELEALEGLLKRLVTLPRKRFEAIMECIRGFKRAILALRLDHLLAYSNLVFCLESLAQHLEPYAATWDDVPEVQRSRIEKSLKGIPTDNQVRVKAAIVEDRHLRLMKRFVAFVAGQVRPSYYLGEASGVKRAIRPTELETCLKAAYQIRSGYAHSLAKPMEHLNLPMIADGETFTWDGQTVPTFRGLARLLEHVLRVIIAEADPVAPEDIHFMQLVPGTITMKVAPKHALANYKQYKAGWAKRVFSHVVSNVWHLPAEDDMNANVILVEEFMDDAVTSYAQMTSEERLFTLNLIRIYHAFMGDTMKSAWRQLLTKHHREFGKPVWPNIVATILVGGRIDGSGEEILAAMKELRRVSSKPSGPDIPKDIALAGDALGVSRIYDHDPRSATERNKTVVWEAAGRPAAQALLAGLGADYTMDALQRALLGVLDSEDRTAEEE